MVFGARKRAFPQFGRRKERGDFFHNADPGATELIPSGSFAHRRCGKNLIGRIMESLVDVERPWNQEEKNPALKERMAAPKMGV